MAKKHERPTPNDLNDMIYATFQIEEFWYKGLTSLSKEDQKKLLRDIQKIRSLLSDIEIEVRLEESEEESFKEDQK